MSEKILSPNADSERNDSVHFTRHSKAKYARYDNAIKGDNPEGPMDYENQPNVDLTEAGIELAHEKAVELFDTMNVDTDALFIVSSPERRALDTANIYREVAKKRGFEVIAPENVRSDLAQNIGEGDIRVLETLSTKIDNVLVSTVFNPEKAYNSEDVNWEAVSADTKDKFEQARQIIAADDKGSWGANFYAHSENIGKLFPGELETAQDVYEKQFKNIIRLSKFGMKKAAEADYAKNIKILPFGHEGYLAIALQTYFDDHAIDNCESIAIDVGDDEGVVLERRGVRREI